MLNAIARPSRVGQLFGHVFHELPVPYERSPRIPPFHAATRIRVPAIKALGKRKEGRDCYVGRRPGLKYPSGDLILFFLRQIGSSATPLSLQQTLINIAKRVTFHKVWDIIFSSTFDSCSEIRDVQIPFDGKRVEAAIFIGMPARRRD